MNILFLPINIASIPSITATALNKIEGINAKNIIASIHKYQNISECTIILPKKSYNLRNPFKLIISRYKYGKELKKWIDWADIVHYIWGPAFSNGIDVKWSKMKNKPIFIEWVGSEIRNPEVLFKINTYYKKTFNNGYEYKKLEESNNKQKVQNLFAKAGSIATVTPEVSLFLDKKLFPRYHILNQRLNLQNFIPKYPSTNNFKPLIIHSPTAKIAKGSNIITAIIDELKKVYEFEFVLLENMRREDVLEKMQNADIFLDQIICGGYGMATTEAMAFGKPVLCYILPDVFKAGLSEECPIVNSNPDNLKDQLIKLITNPLLRNTIGKQSRIYVEKYHDADKIALQLLKLYQKELKNLN